MSMSTLIVSPTISIDELFSFGPWTMWGFPTNRRPLERARFSPYEFDSCAFKVAFEKRINMFEYITWQPGLWPVTQLINGDKPLQSSVTVALSRRQ